MSMSVKIGLLRGELPRYQTEGSAAVDLAWQPDSDHPRPVYADRPEGYQTGVSVEIPPGYVGLILPRSGLTSKGIVAQVGVIDPDYRGELWVTLVNTTDSAYAVQPGQRIAQLLILQAPRIEFITANHLSPTERGAKGFGSTGQ